MKILCMCEGGNVRSGALAYLLKNEGVDAIQIGWRFNTPETINMLAEWANYIVLLYPFPIETTKIDTPYHHKIRVLNVGHDVFGSNTHPVLMQMLMPHIQEWKARGFIL